MAVAPLVRSSLWKPAFAALLSRTFAFSSSPLLRSPPLLRLRLGLGLRPLIAVTEYYRLPAASAVRCFSSRPTTSSLNDPSPNWSNRPPKETILLDGCDFEHWLVVLEKPDENATRDEIIDSYIKTLAQVVGSEEEARKKIYSVSTRCYFAFGALVSEELSYKIKELPRVRWVLPDSYLDVKNKDYGGEPFIDGKAVPYDPKYHEEWIRNNARANERSRRNDRPRNFDRSRNFERRRENMMNRDFQSSPPPMPNRDMQSSAPPSTGVSGAPNPGYVGAPNPGYVGAPNSGSMPAGDIPASGFQNPNPGSMPNTGFQNPSPGSMPNTGFQNPNTGSMPHGGFQNSNPGSMPSSGFQNQAAGGHPPGGYYNNAPFQQGGAPNRTYPNQGGMPNNANPNPGMGGMPSDQGYQNQGSWGGSNPAYQNRGVGVPNTGYAGQAGYQNHGMGGSQNPPYQSSYPPPRDVPGRDNQ